MEAKTEALEAFYRYIQQQTTLKDFNTWLAEASFLEPLLGKTEYQDLLSFDAWPGAEERFRTHLENLVEKCFPGESLRLKAKGICQGILSGSIDALTGARKLSDLRHRPGGDKVIPLDFVGLDSETDGLPTPDRYHLWEPNALRERLPAIERCRSEILYAVREFLHRRR